MERERKGERKGHGGPGFGHEHGAQAEWENREHN